MNVSVPATLLQHVLQFVKLSAEISAEVEAEKQAAAHEAPAAVDALISADLLKPANRETAVKVFGDDPVRALQGLRKAAQQFGARPPTMGTPSDDLSKQASVSEETQYANPLNRGEAGQAFLSSFGLSG